MTTPQALNAFYSALNEMHVVKSIDALLEWDQNVYMPRTAAEHRAKQIEYMQLMVHNKMVDPKLKAVVDALWADKDNLIDHDLVNVREMKRVLDRQTKLPEDFIAQKARESALCYNAWVEARPKNDFDAIKPQLSSLFDLAKKEADLVGYEEHPYDALLDEYEPGATLSSVKPLLTQLAEELRKIIPTLADKYGTTPPLDGKYPDEKQLALCKDVVADMGYSFDSGRLDPTAHPFMTTIGPADFRITTRFMESDFLSALYSTIHEAGHALYEMGFAPEHAGTPMAEAASTGIHESQSRIWENIIGRSHEFCNYLEKVVAEHFPEEANNLHAERLWQLVNRVKPSLIRVESDEVTYSQHIVIRMLIEESIMTGDLKIDDLPGAWNDMYEKYLGVRPETDKDGCMQDVHWFIGAVGYFPTYALGNLYNSMMMDEIVKDIPDIYKKVETGDFAPLLDWLRKNVHRLGMTYRPTDLIKHITGEELSATPFVDYIKTKLL